MIAGLPPAAWILILLSVLPAFLVALAYWLRNRPRRGGVRRDS